MKNKLLIVILLSILVMSCSGQGTTSSQNNSCSGDSSNDVDGPVILIKGQSNAKSHAKYQEYEKIENLYVLDDCGKWVSATPSLDKYSNISPDKRGYFYGYSFGYSFAKEYLDKYGGNLKIISNARGGSKIDFLLNEGFDKTIERISKHKDQIIGILYHQGESDWENTHWIEEAVTLVNNYRDYIGRDVPFVFGELCSHEEYYRCVGYQTFNENLNGIGVYLNNISVASTEGFDTSADVHFNKEMQIEFGIRYFEKYDGLIIN